MTTTQTALCGSTTLGLFDNPLGPCVREQDHPQMFHRDERGTEWRQSNRHHFTALPVDPEMERIATERAVQAAEESEKSAAWFRAHSGGPSVADMLNYSEIPAELLSQRDAPYGPRNDFTVEAYESNSGIWAPVRFKLRTIDDARLFRDNNRSRFPDGTRMRIVEWTESSSVAEEDEETT